MNILMVHEVRLSAERAVAPSFHSLLQDLIIDWSLKCQTIGREEVIDIFGNRQLNGFPAVVADMVKDNTVAVFDDHLHHEMLDL